MSADRHDVLVVGGGPGGSACATRLVAAGLRVAIIDRESFPRLKLCAGWITPEVVADLALDPQAYPYRFNTFETIVAHLKGMRFDMNTPQHSIRRYEFDRYLLERSGAPLHVHNVRSIERDGSDYVLDGRFRAPFLVGAGGTRCPVYRLLFREVNPRARELQAATYEHEFPFQWRDPRCHLWFFEKGLPGYSWYVPKADGYLNVGLGGMAEQLKARGEDVKSHWRRLVDRLRREGFIDGDAALEPKGYSYYLRGGVDVVRRDNAFIVGDAVGLATRDLCEGIGPAVRSGQLAAEAILGGEEYSLESISAYSAGRGLVRRTLEYMFVGRSEKALRRAA